MRIIKCVYIYIFILLHIISLFYTYNAINYKKKKKDVHSNEILTAAVLHIFSFNFFFYYVSFYAYINHITLLLCLLLVCYIFIINLECNISMCFVLL